MRNEDRVRECVNAGDIGTNENKGNVFVEGLRWKE